MGGRGRRGGRGDRDRRGRGKGEGKHIPRNNALPYIVKSRRRDGHPYREEEEATAEEEQSEDTREGEEERERDVVTPQGTPIEVTCVGGDTTPQWKTRTSRDSPLNVRTFCFRESMETSRTITMDRTWTGE